MTRLTVSAATWLFLVFLCSSAIAAPALSIRFCPAARIYSYPLDAEGKTKSVLSGFAIINNGSSPSEISAVHIDLLSKGQVIETRVLGQSELAVWASNQAGLRNVATVAPSNLCGSEMISRWTVLAGPRLKPHQAFVVTRQVFAFRHDRDALRVRVEGMDRLVAAEATIPVRSGFAKTRFRFPLAGTWYVGWGPSFHTDHRWHPPEEFALDIARLGGNGITHSGNGLRFEDYYDFGAPVLAAADGTVVRLARARPENAAALQRPDESARDYVIRHTSEETNLLGSSKDAVAGNYVMLDHGNGEYSLYAHLQPDSVSVHMGERVKTGQVLGRLGSSGNSTEPHLHFQVCNRPEPLLCEGIPVWFSNITILWADGPRALQSGDIVTAQ